MLNAKPENVRKESQIIAQAGLPKAVTIATNMAGRGTDIVLGGNPKGLALRVLLKFFARRLLTGDQFGLITMRAVHIAQSLSFLVTK